jgi:hypothetical protein
VSAEALGGACTDAERRTARRVQRRLLAAGRDAALETVWVRPQWPLSLLLHAGLGVAGSLAAVAAPWPAAGALLVVLVSAVVEAVGRGRVLSLVLDRRATQNVVSPAPHERPYRLIVTAALDAPRGGALARRAGDRLSVLLALLLLAALGCAAARSAGASGAPIGAVQLVPTLGLVAICAIAIDAATSGYEQDAEGAPAADAATSSRASDAAGAIAADGATSSRASDAAGAIGTALDLIAALDAAPPRALGVELVLAGAGRPGALGFARHLRARRLAPERTAVLELRAAATTRWWTHDGPLLAISAPAQLRALADRVASEEAALGARPDRSHTRSAAYAARQRRLPSLGVGGPPGATLDFSLALVAALDDELAGRREPAAAERAVADSRS